MEHSTCLLTNLLMLLYIAVGVSVGQKPCCWGEQWEGVLTQRQGVYDSPSNFASLGDVTTHTSVDLSGPSQVRVYNDIVYRNGSKVTYLQVLDDYSTDVSYTVVNGYCIKGKIGKPLAKNCVPDTATHLGTHNISGVLTDTWLVAPPSYTPPYTTTRLTVSRNGCVPLTQFLLTFDDTSRMSITNFQNVTKSIKDPAVFDVPKACTKLIHQTATTPDYKDLLNKYMPSLL